TAVMPGNGTLSGNGRMRVRGGDDWNVALKADKVAIEKNMVPMVATMFPMLASADQQVAGNINADFVIKGNGLTWEAMRPSLDGTGEISLTGLQMPTGSLLAQVASLAGRADGAIDLNNAGASFGVKDGWVNFSRLSASGKKVRYDFAGRVSLTGQLDLNMDLMPLVQAFGGGKAYGELAKAGIKEMPMRIQGTTAKPDIKAPKAEDFLKGAASGLIEKGLGKALDRIGRGGDK
ncbi:MAG: AsmA-like C-terminal region-containing protein, partial [Planctomycetota bacterium]|nr:AsmA-like C-terminal region-containing protein [Planctomycetota bacterium]